MLSMSERKKAEKYRQRLQREFAWALEDRVQPEVRRRTEELRQHLKEKTAETEKEKKLWQDRLHTSGGPGNRGVMSHWLFRQILGRLHPDAGGDNNLFIAFNAMKARLTPGKDVLAEQEKLRRKQERKRK
jgi:hypothetical protein